MVLQFNHFVLCLSYSFLCLFFNENKSIENKYSCVQFIQFIFADTCKNKKEILFRIYITPNWNNSGI